ncbi:MAG TPA: hypothetical protein PLF31_00790 [Candidatus Paceibacterota bacterium]|nr:hypothetical protein [Candidatus Paceibacterota bacterium]
MAKIVNGVLSCIIFILLIICVYWSRSDQLSGDTVSPTDQLASALSDLKKGKQVKFESVRQGLNVMSYNAFVREAADKAGISMDEATALLNNSVLVTTKPTLTVEAD